MNIFSKIVYWVRNFIVDVQNEMTIRKGLEELGYNVYVILHRYNGHALVANIAPTQRANENALANIGFGNIIPARNGNLWVTI